MIKLLRSWRAAPRPAGSVHRRVPWFSLGILGLLVACGLFPGLIAPMDPLEPNFAALNVPPMSRVGEQLYLLGSDHLGRDVLSRIIHGSSIALYVSMIAVLFSSVVGTTLGLVSGYFGGWVDQCIMRLADTWIALPTVSFAIFLTALREPSATNIIIVMTLVFWTRYARIVRGEVLSLRERDFVKLAITAGASPLRILAVHLLPNVVNSVIVLATLLIGNVILSEATLSFLGLGVPAPNPAWGAMLADGRNGLMSNRWWATVFPGVAIMLVVGSSNLIGDWLRRRLDPNLRNL